jgi:hypothetical protein
MNVKQTIWLLVIVAVSSAWLSPASGAPPWAGVLSFDRVDADPDKEYVLTADNGPWMIMASTLSANEAGRQQARELVLELRKRYKLPAYTHEMVFDFGDTQARGVDRYGEPVKARYRRGSEGREVAVLVGNYRAVDDSEAQKTLKRLKYSLPESLDAEKRKTNQTLAALRQIQKRVLAPGNEKKKLGPMGRAFVTTNPLLPKEYYVPKGLDNFVIKMNKGVNYSLLDCPGRYTVRVGTFTGNAVYNLTVAAEKAHRLTEALRIKGYEAYEFHDAKSSIVTVGSFDSLGTTVGGQLVLDANIQNVIRVFSPDSRQSFSQTPSGAPSPYKSFIGIPFDIRPLPIEAPKGTISGQIAGGAY